MRNSITQSTQRTGRAAARLRLFAFSGFVLEDGERVHHYAGYKAGFDIDEAYREAMAECYRQFSVDNGYESHSVAIVEIPGISF